MTSSIRSRPQDATGVPGSQTSFEDSRHLSIEQRGTFDEILRSADDLTMGQSDGRKMRPRKARPCSDVAGS
jgi:hypothetical protein